MPQSSDGVGEEESGSNTAAPVKIDLVFQQTYKETTGSKSSKLCGHGYLSNPNKTKLLQDKIEEQGRVVDRLRAFIADDAANKEAEKEQLKAALRAELMEEFATMMAQNNAKAAVLAEVIS
jgi:predicted house-cleaning noncanonical NTP pyrophosphatase (MazG superfamily)